MYILQLLPDEEQCRVLAKALKKFSETAVSQRESDIADELELKVRIAIREKGTK